VSEPEDGSLFGSESEDEDFLEDLYAGDTDSDGSSDERPICSRCGIPETSTVELKQCTRCRIEKYCSKLCQKNHWKNCHKYVCNSVVALMS
jgi:hypothetical protein